jgi:hypothetical protein
MEGIAYITESPCIGLPRVGQSRFSMTRVIRSGTSPSTRPGQCSRSGQARTTVGTFSTANSLFGIGRKRGLSPFVKFQRSFTYDLMNPVRTSKQRCGPGTALQLPFLSRVTLKNSYKLLDAYGYRVAVWHVSPEARFAHLSAIRENARRQRRLKRRLAHGKRAPAAAPGAARMQPKP